MGVSSRQLPQEGGDGTRVSCSQLPLEIGAASFWVEIGQNRLGSRQFVLPNSSRGSVVVPDHCVWKSDLRLLWTFEMFHVKI